MTPVIPRVHIGPGLHQRGNNLGGWVVIRCHTRCQTMQGRLTALVSGVHIRAGPQATERAFPRGCTEETEFRPIANPGTGRPAKIVLHRGVRPQRQKLVDDRLVAVPHRDVQRCLALVVAGVHIRAEGDQGAATIAVSVWC